MTTLEKVITGLTIFILLLAFAVPVFGSRIEAKTFNRITGGDVTTWEALWVELRVDCN